jgi:hypothetical protein
MLTSRGGLEDYFRNKLPAAISTSDIGANNSFLRNRFFIISGHNVLWEHIRSCLRPFGAQQGLETKGAICGKWVEGEWKVGNNEIIHLF